MVKSAKTQILVIDDEPTNLELLTSILTNADYEVRSFLNGSQALESVRKMLPDLILLDIDMPDMNGFEVCEWLKSNPQTSDVPVIFVSGIDATEDIRQAFSLGAVDYVIKPFNPEEILLRVKNHLALRQAQVQLTLQKKQLEEEIHEREMAEEELRRARDELETRVIERTKELAESEERFRTLMENAAEAFFLHDMDGRIVAVNQFACDNLGYTRAELLSMFVMDVEESHGDMDNLKEIRNDFDADVPTTLEGCHRRKDGSTFPVEVRLGKIIIDGQSMILALSRDITERKQNEEVLREHEEMIRTLVESSQDWIWSINLEGIHTYSNPAFKAILGYSPDEIVGKPSFTLMHEEDRKKIERLLPEWIAEKSGWNNLLIRWRHKNGEWRYLESNSVPILDSKGELTGFRGVDRDVTERMEAEEKLRSYAQRLGLHVQYTPLGVIEWNLDFKVTEWNKAAEKIFGYSRDEAIGRHAADLIIPDGAKEHVDRTWNALLEGEGGTQSTNENKTKDGMVKVCNWHNTTLVDPEGEIIGVASLVQDITEAKRAEIELLKEKDFSTRLIQTTPAFFVAIDAGGKVLIMNIAMSSKLGYEPEEVIGADYLNTFIPEADREALGELFGRMILAREKTVNENRVVGRDGSTFLVEWHGCPVIGSDGEVESFIGVGIDITDRKNLEEELRQTQKLEAIGTLAGGIAHDFNNILGAVMGYTQLLQMGVESGDEPDWSSLDEILRAAYRAKDLVQQILTFSRRTEAKKEPVRIDLIAKEALKLLRGGLPSNIEINQDIALCKRVVMADATQMHQVVMNLCTNAAHAMGERGGVLAVAVHVRELDQDAVAAHAGLEPGSYLELKVSDTGYGIASENLGRIFEPFFTSKEHGEGTGLGLAVVHGIVQDHGGMINVQSELDSGTTFRVCLPLIKWKEEDPEVGNSLQDLPRGHERILVVDDEESLLIIASKILLRLGYEVMVRDRATAAYELIVADKEHFDLILTDLMMPKMTGIELAQKLTEAGENIPMILNTGYSEKITFDKAKEFGFESLLKKPFNIEELAETVRRVLDQDN